MVDKMKPSYLIYHPQRQQTNSGQLTVYHDGFGGNEDPYLWNDKFLHTYCHITQLKNQERQINFWVSGDKYPNFSRLFCDCVFVVAEKCFWKNSNHIKRHDPVVDNDHAFEYHYKWVNPPDNHHQFKKRRRYTLKADSKKSFQPQDNNRKLIDVVPFLERNGVDLDKLITGMTSKRGSRPFKLEGDLGQKLYDYLFKKAAIRLKGKDLSGKHPGQKKCSTTSFC